ncbi:MAG: hypothetical protein AAGJ83_04925 [Planctomycetota bacterium]
MNQSLHGRLFGLAIFASLMTGGLASAQYPLSGNSPRSETMNADLATQRDANGSQNRMTPPAPAPSIFNSRFERPRLSEAKPQQALNEDVASSSDMKSLPTAAEIRQARAQYRSQQRIARMERNLWAGYEPLRPNWNSIPMMSSRYASRHTIVVPIYVFSR